MMFFVEPLGLALLLALPLLVWLLARGVRRRVLVVPAFPILRERLLELPFLPANYLRRRRISAALFLAGAALLALAAGGPFLGSPAAKPVTVLLVLDHLAGGATADDGKGGGWENVRDTAGSVLGRLRGDDRVLVVRTDTGTVSGGPGPPKAALQLVAALPASELPPDPPRIADLIRALAQAHRPDAVVLVTPDPSRWRKPLADAGLPLTLLRSGATAGDNLGFVAVEMRPDLMNPRKIDLFCRVGFFAAGAPGTEIEATVEVRGQGALLARQSVRLGAGESRGLTFANLLPEPGLLEARLLPADRFPSDNLYRVPVRERPFLTAALVSAGNPTLEAALRALTGLELTKVAAAADLASPLPAVAVFDNASPGNLRTNLLLVRPQSSGADLIVRGEVLRPGGVQVEPGEPVLEGVSLAGLKVAHLPVYLPSPSFRVVARMGGYPLVMLGKNALGRRTAVIGFDPVESEWRYDPSFPVLVANLVSWLGEDVPGVSSSYHVGDALAGEALSRAVEITGPDGTVIEPEAAGAALRMPLSGRYLLRASSKGDTVEVHANLVDERVSRAMALSSPDPGDQVPGMLSRRPMRFALQAVLLGLSFALLAAEMAIAPPRGHGRLPR